MNIQIIKEMVFLQVVQMINGYMIKKIVLSIQHKLFTLLQVIVEKLLHQLASHVYH